jgi:hypothetical protein
MKMLFRGFLSFIFFISGGHLIGVEIVYHWCLRDINIFSLSKKDARED